MYKFRFVVLFFIIFSSFLFAETDKNSLIEAHMGFFTPSIDNEKGLNNKPYSDIFNEDGVRFGLSYYYEVLSGKYFGTFSLSVSMEYFRVSGYGKYENDSTVKSNDETVLSMLPFEMSLSYTLGQLLSLFNIPFTFYGKLGLNYNIWWITNGLGEISDYQETSAIGGKKGWHYALGVRLLLDFFDRDSALSFDNQYGINNSFIFVEYNDSCIDDFSEDGFKLGGAYWRFGLALEF